ncbi:MAG: HTTM domain-containing protein, partial [Bacteroidota bacterium]
MLSGLRSALLQPVSGASLAVARMAFGVTVVVEVGRYVYHDWIWAYYVEPVLRLTYYGWGWVPAASYPVLLVVFGLLAAAGAALALGYRTRLAATATALLLGYVFLLEQGRYLNHIYLMVVLAALFALLPSGGAWSLDRWRQSKAWRGAIPAWGLRAFQTQLALVYTTAAVAKINGDWLRGEPIGMWLEPTLAGSPLAVLLGWEPWPLLFAWGGLALDLLAVPALFWRRTRVLAVAALVSFHLFNAWAFEIGVFPWLM